MVMSAVEKYKARKECKREGLAILNRMVREGPPPHVLCLSVVHCFLLLNIHP